MKPVIAIVGRPNVGKSTLFNRLAGKRKAIVEDIPGVTRDRLYDSSDWEGRDFIIIDTGGIRYDDEAPFASEIRMQVEIAIEEADLILFVVDAREGATSEDAEVAQMLRKTRKPVILIANKVEDFGKHLDYYDFYKLGLGEPIPFSAMHGMNIDTILDEAMERIDIQDIEDEAGDATRIAIVGRPNVGKSSLVNALLGEHRVIVSEVSGTTRDSIDTPFAFEGKDYLLVDTAGIRRRSRIRDAVEKYSIIRALKSIDRADVAVLILDAQDKVTEQDQRIAGYIHEQGKANIIVVNKWDLIAKDTRTMNEFDRDIREELKFMAYSPILYVSALTRQRIFKIIELVDFVADQHHRRITTGELNQVINEAMMLNPLPGGGKKRAKIFYCTQVKTAPPTFVLFANDPDMIHFSYIRYLENVLRKNFGFEGSPVRIIVRQRSQKEE